MKTWIFGMLECVIYLQDWVLFSSKDFEPHTHLHSSTAVELTITLSIMVANWTTTPSCHAIKTKPLKSQIDLCATYFLKQPTSLVFLPLPHSANHSLLMVECVPENVDNSSNDGLFLAFLQKRKSRQYSVLVRLICSCIHLELKWFPSCKDVKGYIYQVPPIIKYNEAKCDTKFCINGSN